MCDVYKFVGWAGSSALEGTLQVSLLCAFLSTLLTLSRAVAIHAAAVPGVEVLARGSVTLTSVARAAHHVFAERAALLDRRIQVLIRLLLNRLRVLQLFDQFHLN